MSYSGKYRPKNPTKYKGDPTNVIYRSLWERKFMMYCDTNDKILEWGSEEFAIPYRDPVSGGEDVIFQTSILNTLMGIIKPVEWS